MDHPEKRSAGSQIPEAELRRVVCIGDENVIISLQMTTAVEGLCLHKAKYVQLRIETLFRNTNVKGIVKGRQV